MNHERVTPLEARSRAVRPQKPALSRTTNAVRAGIGHDQQHGSVMPPLYLSSNFTFSELGVKRQYDYTRSGNPTRDQLGDALCALEGGAEALVTCSGMSAVHLALQLVEPGAIVVAPHDCYGGTFRLLETAAERGQYQVRFVDQTDLATLETALVGAALLWIETPSNPLLRITDIRRASELAGRADCLTVVDNTFLSPARQRPLALGADVVVHSTTKYINGHSDVVGGAVVARTPEVGERLAFWCNCLGLSASPFDSYQCLRGLRTLEARWRIHDENAGAVVALLSGHEAVTAVYHPSLRQHPGHKIARAQQDSFGAMVSFELCGGEAGLRAFLSDLRCFSLAESLGGVESLVAHPATMTHVVMSEEARAAAGISDQLLRLSIGLEATADLVDDLRRGLDRALAAGAEDARDQGQSLRRHA